MILNYQTVVQLTKWYAISLSAQRKLKHTADSKRKRFSLIDDGPARVTAASTADFDPLLHFYKRLHWPAAGDSLGRPYFPRPRTIHRDRLAWSTLPRPYPSLRNEVPTKEDIVLVCSEVNSSSDSTVAHSPLIRFKGL